MILISSCDLVKRVELWGFEPQTSCMPSSGRTSTAVHPCRSPSQGVCRAETRPWLLSWGFCDG